MRCRPGQMLLATASLAFGLLLGACSSGSDTSLNPGDGNVRIVISSAGATAELGTAADTGLRSATDHHDGERPGPQAAEVTFSTVLARNLDGRLVELAIDLPVTVDLLALRDGREFSLPIGSLPPGTYDQIVVVLRALTLVTHDGTRIDITAPGGGWTRIVRVRPFEVVEGEVTTVRIRFRPERSFRWLDDRWEFEPWFEEHHD